MTRISPIIRTAVFLALAVSVSRAEDIDRYTYPSTPLAIEAIDIPTAEVLDPATYSTNFRFYDDGGVTSRLVIGPLKRVNLGIYFDAQGVIGSSDAHMIEPKLFFKLRAFDGTDFVPAIAVGYDSQGYLYKIALDDFLHQEKGAYIVASHAILVPSLELHAGVNVNNFDNAKAYGFTGLTLGLGTSFSLLAEYDALRNVDSSRFNLGGRLFITSYFNIDVAARNIGRPESEGAERIVRLNYVGHFPF